MIASQLLEATLLSRMATLGLGQGDSYAMLHSVAFPSSAWSAVQLPSLGLLELSGIVVAQGDGRRQLGIPRQL
ncbi:hypothetical protein F4777DRAFT_569716 [Nemania sp. FL0916]|nr:hypothetical protein F4777DRAFT_569716 [Nemania sp. FL0916]